MAPKHRKRDGMGAALPAGSEGDLSEALRLDAIRRHSSEVSRTEYEMTEVEIAECLGVTRGCVSQLLQSGLAKLRAWFEEDPR